MLACADQNGLHAASVATSIRYLNARFQWIPSAWWCNRYPLATGRAGARALPVAKRYLDSIIHSQIVIGAALFTRRIQNGTGFCPSAGSSRKCCY
ncbi:hypothetical protein EVAR_24883_1 [Eumeta japonica]|uniref:Uncharacterized protein n=1 Tax=Eumeta variegata TaxID=151549 RepID=A0A4C1V5T4_EUMVA|nr:hypothetical protein EVAR_24883_1 [Eumeta japonica]